MIGSIPVPSTAGNKNRKIDDIVAEVKNGIKEVDGGQIAGELAPDHLQNPMTDTVGHPGVGG